MRWNAVAFYTCLILAGLAYWRFEIRAHKYDFPSMVAVAILSLALIGAAIHFDVLAFRHGAAATISQMLLRFNRRVWFARDVLTFVVSALCAHVIISHVRGTPYDWRAIGIGVARFLVVAAAGFVVGATLGAQEPNRDVGRWR